MSYSVIPTTKFKREGKSGGARIITYIITANKEVYLLTIYDKSELDSVDDKMIKSIISDLSDEN